MDRALFSSIEHDTLRLAVQSPRDFIATSNLSLDHVAISHEYFATIHQWLPFISQKRLLGSWGAADSDTCDTLLILCMRLNTMEGSPASENSIVYTVAKSLCAVTEANGVVTLRFLQSLVLLCLFEISHAIYPAAYLTVGRAARLGILMGFHKPLRVVRLFKLPRSFTVQEEQRRTWWTIFILDRCDKEPQSLGMAIGVSMLTRL